MAAKRDVVVDQLDMDGVNQAPVTKFDDGCFNLSMVRACVADGTCRVVPETRTAWLLSPRDRQGSAHINQLCHQFGQSQR